MITDSFLPLVARPEFPPKEKKKRKKNYKIPVLIHGWFKSSGKRSTRVVSA
jgi:hypothetical protein